MKRDRTAIHKKLPGDEQIHKGGGGGKQILSWEICDISSFADLILWQYWQYMSWTWAECMWVQKNWRFVLGIYIHTRRLLSLVGRLHYTKTHRTAPRMGKACGSRLLPGKGTSLQVGPLSLGHLPWPTSRQERSTVHSATLPLGGLGCSWHSSSRALLLFPSLENT